MDFDLFMERYGYKILFGIFGLVLLMILGVLAFSVYAVLKLFGLFAGGLLLLFGILYAFTVKRRVMDAQAQAHAKYFYDDRPKR
ncbi:MULTISPECIES: hypothetical protein [Thermococcus]|uniref:Uncharacterized protein n=1 Tax=Thermococcus thioreducens TaxID=277988 RepID=A0A0Q2S356_9EURY|nr:MULTISPECIES: hypothetical protein [Thermococcus]ASJ11763.1 hypothetical protein A3L14_02155 [Thermococcus thioreducens]KQH81947.1 hypothetical protein AMR53_08380 [Thermococcus thioreducens]NJE09585.1 hypothetical protein [Thermococcus sp. MAR1]SEW14285.1 hypothetical protein SAMN05216170_1849 [Thermococcus thioreducens]